MGLQQSGTTKQLNHLELAASESEVKVGPETLHLWLTLELTAVLWGLCLVPVQFASLLYFGLIFELHRSGIIHHVSFYFLFFFL